MKYSSEKNRVASVSRKSLIGIVLVATLLVIGVVTGLSMNSGQTPKAKAEERKPTVTNPSRGNYVTSNAAGQTVVVDRQTGQARPLTPEEAQLLAQGIKQLVNQSTDGLVQIRHENGAVSMNLQGRFQDVLVAKKEADGSISQACVNNVDSAAAFFEIDPALVGSSAPVSKTQSGSPNPLR